MTTVCGEWVDSLALTKSAFDYVSAKWESSTTCVTVGRSARASAVLRSIDSGYTWTDVTDTVTISQHVLLTDIAAGPSKAYVVTGININSTTNSKDGVAYTFKDGKTFSVSLKLAGVGLNGAAVGLNGVAFVVGVSGKIYRSVLDTFDNDIFGWTDVSPTTVTVKRSSTCCTTFI